MDNSELKGSEDSAFRITSKTPPPQVNGARRWTRDQISLEAVINVLIQRGLCTEEQLLNEETRLRAIRRTVSRMHFQPVRRTSAAGKARRKRHPIKQWAAQRRWARQAGSLLFGWKWRKFKKKEKSSVV